MAKEKRTSVYFDRKKFCFVGLDDAHMKQIKAAYVGVDVDKELKKMCLWLMSPKGKQRKGEIGFILNWLNNATPTGLTAHGFNAQIDFLEYESPLRPLLLEYMQDLWKGKEHILEFNMINRATTTS